MDTKLQIPDHYIETVVKAAIVESLCKSDQLISNIVTACLNQKVSSYGNETYFIQEVNKLIQEASKNAFKEWIEEHEKEIRTALLKALNARIGLVNSIVEQTIKGISSSMYVSVRIDNSDRR